MTDGPSEQFEQKIADFLAHTFPPLPGATLLDEGPAVFADLQMQESLHTGLPCHVTIVSNEGAPVIAPFMPTPMQLQLLCDIFAQDSQMQHDRLDSADARSHVFAHTLRAHGFTCKKIFVHGDLGVDTPNGSTVMWGYRCAPLIYVKDSDGTVKLQVVDLTLHAGAPLAPVDWIKLFCRGDRITVEITPSSQMSPPSLTGWDIADFGDSRAQALALLHRS